MYYKNGQLVKESEVPQPIRDSKEFGVPIPLPETVDEVLAVKEDMLQEAQHPERKCIFCGQYAKLTRFLDGQTVYLCEEHNSMSIGQIAHQLRGF